MSLSAVSTARGAALGVGWVPDLRTNTLNAPRACARAAIRMPALALELTRRPHAPSRSPLRPRRARSAATPAAAHRRPWRSRGRQWRLQRHCLVVCGSTGVRVLICRPGGWVVCASACFCARRTSPPDQHSLHRLLARLCGQSPPPPLLALAPSALLRADAHTAWVHDRIAVCMSGGTNSDLVWRQGYYQSLGGWLHRPLARDELAPPRF